MSMKPDMRIEDIIAMLDGSVEKGVGHINVDVDEKKDSTVSVESGCADCSSNPTACSIPTLHIGLDDEEEGK